MTIINCDNCKEYDKELRQLQDENDKVMHEVYMRRKETKELRAEIRKLKSGLQDYIDVYTNKCAWAADLISK